MGRAASGRARDTGRTSEQLYRIEAESGNQAARRVSRARPPTLVGMAILVDTPMWPAHGRLWAHLVSDDSLDELHTFAAACGLPSRAFDLDHYDVPAERVADLVAAGAVPVTAGELTRALIASGLRVRAKDRSTPTPGEARSPSRP